ncbi:hypothetical protein [Thermococcus thioreducens]|uniref:hypothetical protein n=1 Tax=Thermococcus thioreducens TaxID=277988 RepID=UPI00117D10A8|nr:hypothetical protein [Thermococcus thioreducens]
MSDSSKSDTATITAISDSLLTSSTPLRICEYDTWVEAKRFNRTLAEFTTELFETSIRGISTEAVLVFKGAGVRVSPSIRRIGLESVTWLAPYIIVVYTRNPMRTKRKMMESDLIGLQPLRGVLPELLRD